MARVRLLVVTQTKVGVQIADVLQSLAMDCMFDAAWSLAAQQPV